MLQIDGDVASPECDPGFESRPDAAEVGIKSGLEKSVRILQNIEGIAHVELDEEDVVRHKLVKAIIRAYEKEKTKEQEEHK